MAEPEKKPAPAPAAAPAGTPGAAKPAPPAAAGAAPAATAPGAAGAHGHGAEGEASAAPQGASKMFSIVAIVLMLLMPGVGFLVAKLVLGPAVDKAKAESAAEGEEVAGEHPDAAAAAAKEKAAGKEHGAEKGKEGKEGGGHGDDKGKKKGDPGGYFVPEVVVNISGTRGTRFLRATFQFEGPADALTELEISTGKIRDIVSTVLASKRMEQLDAPDARQRLRGEVMSLVNTSLKTEQKITNVYITDFVIQ